MLRNRIVSAMIAALCVVQTAGATMALGTNFWNLRWHNNGDCFVNVDNVTGSNPWNPTFLSEIGFYHNLRFMDWDYTNNSTRSQWSQRVQKSSTDQNTVAYEWMVDICNRVEADMWVTLPHRIVNRNTGNNPADYALRLAVLVKTGVDVSGVDLGAMGDLTTRSASDFIAAGGTQTGDPLNANLRVWVEYSNETWNGVFSQSGYCETEGMAMGLDTDATRAGYRFHGYAAIRLFRAFELVFGQNSPRVVNVFAGWVSTMLPSAMHFQVQDDASLNPWGCQADAIGLAPYIGHSANSLQGLWDDIPGTLASCKTARNAANTRGVMLVAYEGGQHITQSAETVNSQSGMYDVYRAYLDSMNTVFDVFSHYNHVGDWGTGGAWGSMRYTGEPIAQAHKYRALYDFQVANPVAVEPQPTPRVPQARLNQAFAARILTLNGRLLDTRTVTKLSRGWRMLAPGLYVPEQGPPALELR